jgi:hypothetical protein
MKKSTVKPAAGGALPDASPVTAALPCSVSPDIAAIGAFGLRTADPGAPSHDSADRWSRMTSLIMPRMPCARSSPENRDKIAMPSWLI